MDLAKNLTSYMPLNQCMYISTREELENMCNKYHNGFFDESSDSYDTERGSILRSLDDSYFQNNSIMVCTLSTGDGYDIMVKKLEARDNILIVTIDQPRRKGAYHDNLYTYLLIFEVEKKDYINVNDVEVILNR